MTPIFGSQRFDKGRVIPDSFLEEFRKKDPSTRRYLLNSMTLFACISPEQQHQALNDLIQSELISLAEKSKHYMYDRVISLLQKFNIEKELDDKAIAEYYYRYYLLTGLIPENLTADYLNELIGFIIGLEIIKLLFSMRFVEQQRFFEIQGRYAMQVLLFYRYIKPIRSKIMQDKILEKDVAGTYYYTKARLSEDKLFDSIFEVFKLDKILGIGNLAKDLNFDKDYIYNSPDVPDRDSSFF